MNNLKLLSKRCHEAFSNLENLVFMRVFSVFGIIPTRCRDSHLKQFCLEDVAPAILIILIAHIILAVRWMLIKILSAVINHRGTVITVVSGGCHPNNIIRKIDCKIKMVLRELQENTDATQRGLHPYFIIIPDASADPVPYPRLSGSFPEMLHRFCRWDLPAPSPPDGNKAGRDTGHYSPW